MKVLIVNTSERSGGAAVAAKRLSEALAHHGMEARMLVMNRQTDAPEVLQAGTWLQAKWSFVYERLVIWLHNLLSRTNLFKVSIANTGIDITRTEAFRQADIIHLNWVNQGFLSIKGIGRILRSGKPVVWTMHDMWEMTAICHHAYDCCRYQSDCHDCPFLRRPGRHDLSAKVFRQKRQLLGADAPLTFVAVSEWLADRGRSSALTGRWPIEVIPNVFSLSSFTITARSEARRQLGIDEAHVIAFGAARIDDPIKGFTYLCQALRILVQSGRVGQSAMRLLLFGGVKDASVLNQIPIPYTHLGYIADERSLSLVYSAASVTVSSSLYETFGQTLIEALACGSVPVSFDGSGQADIIHHLQNGYLAHRLSAQSLADGIEWALAAPPAQSQLRASVACFSEDVVAERYANLYRRLLGRRPV